MDEPCAGPAGPGQARRHHVRIRQAGEQYSQYGRNTGTDGTFNWSTAPATTSTAPATTPTVDDRVWVLQAIRRYTYDTLNRLARATGTGWDLTFGYDGFGNLVSEMGTPYNQSWAVNPATNRLPGTDASGNLLSMPNLGMSYDNLNRLVQAQHSLNGTEQYAYNASNQRIWRQMPQGYRARNGS